jgi:glycosyltransferase involved in cell wall biosynthesis
MSDGHRLLCLYPWLEMGGADKFNLDMLAGLISRGWRATLVTTMPSQHTWRAAFAHYSDDIVHLTEYPITEYPARLLHIFETRKIDCALISNSATCYNLLPYLRAHFPHVTFVDYNHMEEPHWRDGGFPRQSLIYADMLDAQIVSSQHLKRWMIERGGVEGRIAVCTTNIDSDVWNPARYDRRALRSALGLPQSAPVTLFAARLERQKQPLLAFDVMRRVLRYSPDAYFLIAGDGMFAGYARGFLRRHGLTHRVWMLGAVSNERVRELLALSDIFFLPSQMEGISLAIYEAMAMGVAPISAAVGGQAELVAPECGRLINRGLHERDDYTAALLHLIDNPALTRHMGDAARLRVTEHFRLEQMQTRMDDLLRHTQALRSAQQHVTLSATQALAAARHALNTARRDEAHVNLAIGADDGMAQRLRKSYRRLVEGGAWRLVPIAERVRMLRR